MTETQTTGIPDPEGPTDIIETDYEIGQDNVQRRMGRFPSTFTTRYLQSPGW